MAGISKERSARLRREVPMLAQRHISVREIARQLHCDRSTVRTIMVEAGLTPRDALAQRVQNAQNRDVPLTPELNQLVAGLLLGDGGIAIRPNRIPRLEMTGKSEEYVRFVSLQLSQHNVTNTVAYHANKYWRVWTQAWPSLQLIVSGWYGDGTQKRSIPTDVTLSPNAVMHWYLGDGGLAKRKGKRPTGYLYTNSFAESHVRRVAQMLTDIDIPALATRCGGKQYHQWRIHLNRLGIKGLLDYIGPCPVAYYAYKWDVDAIHPRIARNPT